MLFKYKHHFFIIPFLLLSVSSFSQGLFQSLLDKANRALNEKINSISDKVINASVNGLENKINGKFTVVSNRINLSNATSRITNNQTTPVSKNNNSNLNNTSARQLDDNTEIIEKQLKDKYPSFYNAYKDVISNNSNVKEVLFIVRDTHEWSSSVIDDKIYFDLFAFDDTKKDFSEGAKIWELLFQVSYLITKNNSTLPTLYDKTNANFTYALTKSKEYAEKGDCTSLKHAVTVWKFKKFNSSNSNNFKEESRNSLIQEDLFKNCESVYLTKCGK
jgi:hypothetical protein